MIEALPRSTVAEAPAPPSAIRVRGLHRTYGALTALDHVDVDVPQGSLCALIGPNGAGKTTLLSILATLDEGYAGDAWLAGAHVRTEPALVRRRMGFVPDGGKVYEDLSVRDYLMFFARAHRLPKAEREGAVERVLGLIGFAKDADRSAAGLSKGMTQRLSVGRALLHDPDVLLLDEPASGLDPRARIDLKQLLKKLQGQGKTVLISSHILTELGDFCDRVLVVEKGRVAASGAISELWGKLHGDQADVRRLLIEVVEGGDKASDLLGALETVRSVAHHGELITVETSGGAAEVAAIVKHLVEAGFGVARVSPERENLEALFLTVTQGEIQ
jgi:ABC-2 type transport system ATP-binding protein